MATWWTSKFYCVILKDSQQLYTMSDKLMMIWHDLIGNVIALAGVMSANYVLMIVNEQMGPMITDPKLRAALIGGLKDFLTMSIYRVFANVPHIQL